MLDNRNKLRIKKTEVEKTEKGEIFQEINEMEP